MISALFFIVIASTSASPSFRFTSNPSELFNNVHTDLVYATADAEKDDMSSSVSQGSLHGISLGSAGAKAEEDLGAATSYGVGQVGPNRILEGAGAAKAKDSEAISRIHYQNLRNSLHRNSNKQKRSMNAGSVTSLNQVAGQGVQGAMGSTGVYAGPVATSISLGAMLLQALNSVSAINAGASAAHSGKYDTSNTFSNSNLYTKSQRRCRRRCKNRN